MKRYIAILNQNGTNVPVATVLENSLGPIVWARSSAGQYVGTLVGAFPADRTTALLGKGQGGEADTPTDVVLPPNSPNFIVVTTKDVRSETGEYIFSDGLLIRTTLEIRVYSV